MAAKLVSGDKFSPVTLDRTGGPEVFGGRSANFYRTGGPVFLFRCKCLMFIFIRSLCTDKSVAYGGRFIIYIMLNKCFHILS